MGFVHNQIAVMMGPTCSGKSALALALARARPTVIINADAMQMVDGLRVITARPTREEEAQAEHALYGVLKPHVPTTVANWLALVKPAIEQAWAEEKLPLLVGGTGMYVKALMEGLASIAPIPEDIRTALRLMDAARVRAALERKDPAMAAELKPGDSQRNLRALEVIEATGVSLGVWQAQTTHAAFPEARYQRLVVMRERAEMYARIDARFKAMVQNGALEEVRALMALNLNPDLPILRAHGVPELMAHLRGEMALDEAVTKAQQNTRNYAKRQMTWLRNQWQGAAVVNNDAEIVATLSGS